MKTFMLICFLLGLSFTYGFSLKQSAPDSCVGRCGAGTDPDASCQCNSACERYDDCCDDYQEVCGEGGGLPSDSELAAISQSLWDKDDNRASSSDYSLNPNGPRFFTYFNEGLFNKPTWNRFRNVINNFNPTIGVAEPPCNSCREEETNFINEIMKTRVMQTAKQWLAARGLGSLSDTGFKQELRDYWFKMYSRSGGTLDSSGFEHVFGGEVRSSGVSGFHSWQKLYIEEKAGNAKYGTTSRSCSLGVYTFSFNWWEYRKPITSVWVGRSPEFELAIYTICFRSRMNRACNMRINGVPLTITNYKMDGVSPNTVATAYPDCG